MEIAVAGLEGPHVLEVSAEGTGHFVIERCMDDLQKQGSGGQACEDGDNRELPFGADSLADLAGTRLVLVDTAGSPEPDVGGRVLLMCRTDAHALFATTSVLHAVAVDPDDNEASLGTFEVDGNDCVLLAGEVPTP